MGDHLCQKHTRHYGVILDADDVYRAYELSGRDAPCTPERLVAPRKLSFNRTLVHLGWSLREAVLLSRKLNIKMYGEKHVEKLPKKVKKKEPKSCDCSRCSFRQKMSK